ncbi:MAG: glycosyltransferase family 4 protein [Gammaproteobacteria bacterium]|nr:glycosyltransferase family 4 protein [Gammaproteobacteria bacterium]
MRILTFGTLYPDATRPQHGIFVEHRLRPVLRRGNATARVVAPVPWFPSKRAVFGEWGSFPRVAAREVRDGVTIDHPRFIVVPKFGMSVAPMLLALGARPALQRVREEGFDFDVIDAQYFYPDGVAAAILGRWFDRPVAITALGSDLNVIGGYALPRRMIRWAALNAAARITVSGALRDVLAGWGLSRDSIHVLRNGVDLDFFSPPADRLALRRELGVTTVTLLAVGNLVPLKGLELVLEALRTCEGVHLVVAGQGPEEARLRRLAADCGVGSRVRFLGRLSQSVLRRWYGACDALVLASRSEGMANVLLESLACGTPVVATAVGGTPEVVNSTDAGRLVQERSPAGLAEGIRSLLAAPPDRATVRRHAERFSWADTAAGIEAVLTHAVTAARLTNSAQ